jgi:hypothetical protein
MAMSDRTNYPPGFWDEPCFDCGRLPCVCPPVAEPPYCPICGGECSGNHGEDEADSMEGGAAASV